MSKIVRPAKHRCGPLGHPHHGTIVRCDCGRLWLAKEPGNPKFARWARISRLGAWLRMRREGL